jgi:protocatechuate 3,4-dioxygenase beta subunit
MMSALKSPSRRLVLKRALAAGGLGLAANYAPTVFAQGNIAPTPACHDGDEPTKPDIEGPFFKPRSPQRGELVEPGTRGRIFQLEGFVLTRSCRPVTGSILDLWHADENGDYDDSGFRYRGHLFSDAAGRYSFRTIMPGLYPGRTRHYHLKVGVPRGRVLTTQLYFPNEPRNARDDYFSPVLLMRIAGGARESTARFDFILDIA